MAAQLSKLEEFQNLNPCTLCNCVLNPMSNTNYLPTSVLAGHIYLATDVDADTDALVSLFS